jgi:hypothetical protein
MFFLTPHRRKHVGDKYDVIAFKANGETAAYASR